MRNRYLGLAIVGGLILGALTVPRQVAAQANSGRSSKLALQQHNIQTIKSIIARNTSRARTALRAGDREAFLTARETLETVEEGLSSGHYESDFHVPPRTSDKLAAEVDRTLKSLPKDCCSSRTAKRKTKNDILFAIGDFFAKLGTTQAPRSGSSSKSSESAASSASKPAKRRLRRITRIRIARLKVPRIRRINNKDARALWKLRRARAVLLGRANLSEWSNFRGFRSANRRGSGSGAGCVFQRTDGSELRDIDPNICIQFPRELSLTDGDRDGGDN